VLDTTTAVAFAVRNPNLFLVFEETMFGNETKPKTRPTAFYGGWFLSVGLICHLFLSGSVIFGAPTALRDGTLVSIA
jgi:hypothetical protein